MNWPNTHTQSQSRVLHVIWSTNAQIFIDQQTKLFILTTDVQIQ